MYMPDNMSLTDQVKSALRADLQLRDTDIDVKNDEGHITLKGVVDSPAQRQRVESMVRTMAGVTMVTNELRIRGQGSQSAGEYIDDAMITTSVKTRLLGEKGIASLKIHVETKDGIVMLTGSADTREHALLAERTAKMADGVVEVRNQLTITP